MDRNERFKRGRITSHSRQTTANRDDRDDVSLSVALEEKSASDGQGEGRLWKCGWCLPAPRYLPRLPIKALSPRSLVARSLPSSPGPDLDPLCRYHRSTEYLARKVGQQQIGKRKLEDQSRSHIFRSRRTKDYGEGGHNSPQVAANGLLQTMINACLTTP